MAFGLRNLGSRVLRPSASRALLLEASSMLESMRMLPRCSSSGLEVSYSQCYVYLGRVKGGHRIPYGDYLMGPTPLWLDQLWAP